MDPFAAQLVADEVVQHLRERTAAFEELGATPETAQWESIARFGTPSLIAGEFDRRTALWAIKPLAGNLIMFGLFMVPVIYEYGFLHFDGVNLLTVLSWFTFPAFCRRWPIWGSLAGVLVIEYLLGFQRGRAMDFAGIAAMIGLTLGSYLIGWLFRRVVSRARDRRKFPFARS